jgi:hypothetical protein
VYPSTSNSGVLTAGLHAVEASGYERGRADERRRVLDEFARRADAMYPMPMLQAVVQGWVDDMRRKGEPNGTDDD